MRSIKGLLVLFAAQAFLVLLWVFFTPSESGRGVVLWLSRERLALAALSFVILLLFLGAALAARRFPAVTASLEAAVERLCVGQQQVGSLLLFLTILPLSLLLGSVALLVAPTGYASYQAWAPSTFPLLRSLTLAALPFLLLYIATSFEAAAYLAVRFPAALHESRSWSIAQVGPALLAIAIILSTFFYWLVLAFQLRFFANNPAWYWKFEPIAFGRGDLLFALVSLGLLAAAWWLLFLRGRTLAGLLALFVLGLFLQFGVGLMSGGGFSAFQARYFSTYHKTYISKAAASSASLAQTVEQYEQLYGARQFTNTKPPGLMVFYTGLDHLINGYPSRYLEQARYERLASIISFAYPVMAMLLVFAIYAFTWRTLALQGSLAPSIAAFLVVLCPNLILFSLFPDQAVYPLLFMLGVVLIVITARRQSWLLALPLSLFMYLAVFFAFTMLPLYPFALVYLALHYWYHRRDQALWSHAAIALAIVLVTLLLYFAFRVFLNYDFLPRFAQAVRINHNFDFYLRVGRPLPSGPESLPARLAQIAGAAWLNSMDFAAAIGFPIYILFAVRTVRLLIRLVRGSALPSDLVLGSLLLSFMVLILAGTAQGEVPRLWLFWLPMVVVLAAHEIEALARRRPWILLVLGISQLATIFLTFHFQDLHM